MLLFSDSWALLENATYELPGEIGSVCWLTSSSALVSIKGSTAVYTYSVDPCSRDSDDGITKKRKSAAATVEDIHAASVSMSPVPLQIDTTPFTAALQTM